MMKITIKMPTLPVLAVLMVAGNVVLYVLAPPHDELTKPLQPEHLTRAFWTDVILIGIGLAVQVWTSGKHRYVFLKRIAYIWTLLISGLVSFGTMQVLLQKLFPR